MADEPDDRQPGPVTDGALLTQILRESGTGEGKLEICRETLLRAEAEGRRASAEEVYQACVNEPARVFQGTLDKMRAIMETGHWERWEEFAPLEPVEDRIARTSPDQQPDARGWMPGEREEAVKAFNELLAENRRLASKQPEPTPNPTPDATPDATPSQASQPSHHTEPAGPQPTAAPSGRPASPGAGPQPPRPAATPPNRPGQSPSRR